PMTKDIIFKENELFPSKKLRTAIEPNKKDKMEEMVNYSKSKEPIFIVLNINSEKVADPNDSLLEDLKNFIMLPQSKKEEILQMIFYELRILIDRPIRKQRFDLEEESIYDTEDVNKHKYLAIFSFLEKLSKENFDELLQRMSKVNLEIIFCTLGNEDQKIRFVANSLLRSFFRMSKKNARKDFKYFLKNKFINILHHQIQPVGLECLLELSLYILVCNGFDSLLELHSFFQECIFPLLNFNNSHLYFNEFRNLFKAFSVSNNSALIIILKKLINLFPNENSDKKIMVVNLVNAVIKSKEIHLRFPEVEDLLARMINHCFQSDHINLINAAYKFISDESNFYLLKQHKSFLIKIFDSFYDLSYTHWNVKKSPEIVSLIDLFMKLDHETYFECVKLYKFKKYKESIDNECLYENENEFDKIFFGEKVFGVRKKSDTKMDD
ncbi:hypothetical protein H312_01153, partial [Anncaliia algerae PRA339]